MNKKLSKILSLQFGGSISLDEKMNFARHLGIIVRAGMPVYEGLLIIQKQKTSKTLRRVIGQVITDVNNGRFLSDGLDRYNSLFGDFFINIIRVGESSGTLSQNLFYLADELKKSKILRGKVRSAMTYPVIVMVATVSVVSFLTFFLFPKLISVFEGLNVELPLVTRILILAVDFLRTYGLWVFAGVVVLVIVERVVMATVRPVKYAIHRSLFFIPVLSDLMVSINAANFTRVLGMLLKGGIKIVEAITITGNTFDNVVYQRAFREIAEEVKKGEQLAGYLGRRKQIFPSLVAGMIGVGENTGNLEENLFYLAEYFTEEVDSKLQKFTSLLEPLLLLVMGLVVGLVAISIILPIYQVTSAVK